MQKKKKKKYETHLHTRGKWTHLLNWNMSDFHQVVWFTKQIQNTYRLKSHYHEEKNKQICNTLKKNKNPKLNEKKNGQFCFSVVYRAIERSIGRVNWN